MKSSKLFWLAAGCLLACFCSSAWASESPITIGQLLTDTISSANQVNRYTLAANKNDVLDFTMVTTKGTVNGNIQLVDSKGTVVKSAGNCCNNYDLEMNQVAIPETETYTVLVSDSYNTNTGTYVLFVERLNGPPGAVNLPFNVPTSGKIASASQANPYTLNLKVNDVLDFTMVTTSGDVSAKSAGGCAICSGARSAPDGEVAGASGTIWMVSSATRR